MKMKKRFLIGTAVLCVLCFLPSFAGCRRGAASSEPSSIPETTSSRAGETSSTSAADGPPFTRKNLPRLDGSTANIPMAALMVQRLLGVSAEEADTLIDFSTTPNAYLALIEKEADLLLVYEADESIKKQIQQSGVELEYHPIGRDALVFLTNQENPVISLTTRQIQDIYQGKITNWSALGGEDKTIEAYQRPEKSGSQALRVKLVMKDLPLMEAPTDRYPAGMGDLIDVLATYENKGVVLAPLHTG